jgi:hypothetical protein
MLIEKFKTSPKLEQLLLNFIDVLRINIFLVDTQGNPILAPKTNGYGWELSSQYGVLKYLGMPEFLMKFEREGDYLKSIDAFGFQTFAIPIAFDESNIIGYLIVGPVVLNKRLDQFQFERIDQKTTLNFFNFMELSSEIRVVTFNSLKSTLDLLFELSRYALKINEEKEAPIQENLVQKTTDISVFITLLDLAMALTQAECGSIMLFNKKTKEFNIKVHKGINPENLKNVRIKLGEGIAGLAAQQKTPFVINEGQSSNRIKHLLKKPEIKCALILPIIRSKEVIGVMNIATHQGNSRLATHSQEMLKSLTKITTTTIEKVF